MPDFQQIALKSIALQVLRHSPEYAGTKEVQLYIPGEILRQELRSPSPVVLYISDFNPGALDLVAELQAIGTNITTVGDMEPVNNRSNAPTHFVLYLNHDTFVGEDGVQLAKEVRCAMASKLPIVMAHENDIHRRGCEFER